MINFDDTNNINSILDTNKYTISTRIVKGKKVTIINGFTEEYDLPKIIKHFKNTFNCNAYIVKSKEGEESIQLAGYHKLEVKHFLVNEGICKEDDIVFTGV